MRKTSVSLGSRARPVALASTDERNHTPTPPPLVAFATLAFLAPVRNSQLLLVAPSCVHGSDMAAPVSQNKMIGLFDPDLIADLESAAEKDLVVKSLLEHLARKNVAYRERKIEGEDDLTILNASIPDIGEEQEREAEGEQKERSAPPTPTQQPSSSSSSSASAPPAG